MSDKKLIAICKMVALDLTASRVLKAHARRTLEDTTEYKMRVCDHSTHWQLAQVAGEGRFCTGCGYHDWSYDD